MRRLLWAPLAAVSILLPGIAGAGKVFHILPDGSGDYPTIQAAIDGAQWGDTLEVAPGTYLENLDFGRKSIVLRGSGPALTILDGGTTEELPCIWIVHRQTRKTIVEGFTITGGSSTYGGGIYIGGASPTIRGNVIRDNSASSGTGGGIRIAGTTSSGELPLIENNVITGNEVMGSGGGVSVFGAAAVLRDNDIIGNTSRGGDGGGIWLNTLVDGTVITGNRITHNVAGGRGGGLCVLGDPPQENIG
jgi:hypothetical protein